MKFNKKNLFNFFIIGLLILFVVLVIVNFKKMYEPYGIETFKEGLNETPTPSNVVLYRAIQPDKTVFKYNTKNNYSIYNNATYISSNPFTIISTGIPTNGINSTGYDMPILMSDNVTYMIRFRIGTFNAVPNKNINIKQIFVVGSGEPGHLWTESYNTGKGGEVKSYDISFSATTSHKFQINVVGAWQYGQSNPGNNTVKVSKTLTGGTTTQEITNITSTTAYNAADGIKNKYTNLYYGGAGSRYGIDNYLGGGGGAIQAAVTALWPILFSIASLIPKELVPQDLVTRRSLNFNQMRSILISGGNSSGVMSPAKNNISQAYGGFSVEFSCPVDLRYNNTFKNDMDPGQPYTYKNVLYTPNNGNGESMQTGGASGGGYFDLSGGNGGDGGIGGGKGGSGDRIYIFSSNDILQNFVNYNQSNRTNDNDLKNPYNYYLFPGGGGGGGYYGGGGGGAFDGDMGNPAKKIAKNVRPGGGGAGCVMIFFTL
uniref:Uncharacterized protein n=1 Tax=viral metagenome TaxID=1070528 RepID=A0A6C0HYL9_9ZZZZ